MQNPITPGISECFEQIKGLNFSFPNTIPSVIVALIICVVIAVLIPIWLLGSICMLEDILRELIQSSASNISSDSFIENSPYVISMGLYIIAWLPFFVLSLPFFITGIIGSKYIANFTAKKLAATVILFIVGAAIKYYLSMRGINIIDSFKTLVSNISML